MLTFTDLFATCTSYYFSVFLKYSTIRTRRRKRNPIWNYEVQGNFDKFAIQDKLSYYYFRIFHYIFLHGGSHPTWVSYPVCPCHSFSHTLPDSLTLSLPWSLIPHLLFSNPISLTLSLPCSLILHLLFSNPISVLSMLSVLSMQRRTSKPIAVATYSSESSGHHNSLSLVCSHSFPFIFS